MPLKLVGRITEYFFQGRSWFVVWGGEYWFTEMGSAMNRCCPKDRRVGDGIETGHSIN